MSQQASKTANADSPASIRKMIRKPLRYAGIKTLRICAASSADWVDRKVEGCANKDCESDADRLRLDIENAIMLLLITNG